MAQAFKKIKIYTFTLLSRLKFVHFFWFVIIKNFNQFALFYIKVNIIDIQVSSLLVNHQLPSESCSVSALSLRLRV